MDGWPPGAPMVTSCRASEPRVACPSLRCAESFIYQVRRRADSHQTPPARRDQGGRPDGQDLQWRRRSLDRHTSVILIAYAKMCAMSLVSVTSARDEYGVVIDPATFDDRGRGDGRGARSRRVERMLPECSTRSASSCSARTWLVRRWEERLIQLAEEGQSFGHYHVYVGQETIGIPVLAALRTDDVASARTHRNHGHMLARGADPGRLLAEVLGKATGLSGGKAGTLHACAPEPRQSRHTSAIVGGTVPALPSGLRSRPSGAVATRCACPFSGTARWRRAPCSRR